MKNKLVFFLMFFINISLLAQDDLYDQWKDGDNLLYYSRIGSLTGVKLLIESTKTDINFEDEYGKTALMYASEGNREKVVKYLLEKGAAIDIKSGDGSTALAYAVKMGRYKIAEILIRNGADINTQDNYGSTPLHYAVVFGYYTTMDMLLYYEADPNIKDNYDYPPLAYALEYVEDTLTVNMLLEYNADINIYARDSSTLLHVAAYDGNLNFIKEHYKRFDINNNLNSNDFTAVDMAVIGGDYETFKWFLDSGYELRDTINKAYSSLTLAKFSGNKEIKKTIRKRGVKDIIYIYPGRMSVGFDLFFNSKDFFMVANLGIHEDRYGFSGEIGYMFRGSEKRILYPVGPDTYYQLREDRKAAYVGFSKDFRFPSEGEYYISLFIKIKSYMFWGKYDGMEMKIVRNIVNSPGVGIAFNTGHFFRLFYEADYMEMPVYGASKYFNTIGIKGLFNIRNKKTNEKYNYIINY